MNPLLRRIAKRREEQAPPLPLSKTSALPNLPKTFFSLRRQAKLHAESASLSACGKHHSPKANITVQPPHGDCTMGDREAVEGARGYESSGLPCMRCLPLFSLVEAEVSSLLCAFSFRHPCGAGRWGKATAPCSHPGGSHSDSRRRANMQSAPTENSKAMGIFSPKQLSHFAVRRNFTPKAHYFPLA